MQDISKFANAFSNKTHIRIDSPVFCINDSVFSLCWTRGITHILIEREKKVRRKNHKNCKSIDSCWHGVYRWLGLSVCISNEQNHFERTHGYDITTAFTAKIESFCWLNAYNTVDYVLNFVIMKIGSGEWHFFSNRLLPYISNGGNFSKFLAIPLLLRLALHSEKKWLLIMTCNLPDRQLISIAQLRRTSFWLW